MVIEAMKDSSIFDRSVAEDILELVMSDLDFWLEEVGAPCLSSHPLRSFLLHPKPRRGLGYQDATERDEERGPSTILAHAPASRCQAS